MRVDNPNLVSPWRAVDVCMDPNPPERSDLNKEIRRVRAVVENSICHLKHWKILNSQYRLLLANFEDIFMACLHLTQRLFDMRQPPRSNPDECDEEMNG